MKKYMALVALFGLNGLYGFFDDITEKVKSSSTYIIDRGTAKLKAKYDSIIRKYKNAVNASQRKAIRRELNAFINKYGKF